MDDDSSKIATVVFVSIVWPFYVFRKKIQTLEAAENNYFDR